MKDKAIIGTMHIQISKYLLSYFYTSCHGHTYLVYRLLGTFRDLTTRQHRILHKSNMTKISGTNVFRDLWHRLATDPNKDFRLGIMVIFTLISSSSCQHFLPDPGIACGEILPSRPFEDLQEVPLQEATLGISSLLPYQEKNEN